jgi:hypothetical protein
MHPKSMLYAGGHWPGTHRQSCRSLILQVCTCVPFQSSVALSLYLTEDAIVVCHLQFFVTCDWVVVNVVAGESHRKAVHKKLFKLLQVCFCEMLQVRGHHAHCTS